MVRRYATSDEVIRFWFEDSDPREWWAKSPEFDRLIAQRFGVLHDRATRCELYGWRRTADGRLAEIVVLDQFSRNMFRGQPKSFAYDALALALAQEAVSVGADRQLASSYRNFLYMPYMHSESAEIHAVARSLFDANGDPETIGFARRHRDIIERFGRYPHRNEVLGRPSSPEEARFLREPGSGF